MVMSYDKKLFISSILLRFLSLLLFALSLPLSAETLPSPTEWLEKLPESLWLKNPGMLRNVSILSREDSVLAAWQLTMAGFSKLGFLQYFDQASLNFVQRLNPELKAGFNLKTVNLDFTPLHLALRDEGNNMMALAASPEGFKDIGTWPIETRDRETSQNFLRWLIKNLAYDGIVLDRKNDLLLVALWQNTKQISQGLLIENSHTLWVLDPKKLQGRALLQMLSVDRHLAIFEVLTDRNNKEAIEIGSKIILGLDRKLEE